MNKTLRNKALKNASRLITADMNGEDWCAPDGYFATAYPIYDGYKVKKDQTLLEGKPLLHKILPTCAYSLAEYEKTIIDGYTDFSGTGTDISYRVDNDYYHFLKHLYPEALPFIANDGNKYAPIELINDGALVAVIMPVKQ